MGPHVFEMYEEKLIRLEFYTDKFTVWAGSRCDHLNKYKAPSVMLFEVWLRLNGYEYECTEFSTGHGAFTLKGPNAPEHIVQMKLKFYNDPNIKETLTREVNKEEHS